MANSIPGFTNTINAFNANLIEAELSKVTNAVIGQVTPFSAYTAKFSDVQSATGTINIPIPVYSTGSGVNSFTIDDATATTKTINLSNDYTKFYAFNPVEMQNGGLQYLVTAFVKPAVYAIEAQLQSDAFALLTNFATASIKPATATACSSSVVTALNAALSTAGINGERKLVLNSSYFWTGLMDDLSKKGNQAGADAIRSGSPNNPFNMGVYEAQLLPTAGNLVGFTGTAGGIIIGTAIPQVVHANGEQAVITTPSGLNVLVEKYFDESKRKYVVGCSVVGNVAVGNAALLRIVSA